MPRLDKKRALIEAYAEKRHEHPPGSSITVYASVAICVAVVLAGWALTTGRGLFSPAHADAAVSAVANSASIFLK